jgi:polysaccharide export outer membrane protein
MRWFVLVGALCMSACSTPRMIDTGRVGIATPDTLPQPTQADLIRGQRVHLVGPFDRISVEVFGLPELSRQVQVDADGRIALPLAGQFSVIGQTPGQLETAIAGRLRSGYVRDPHVTVNVLETVSQVVTVDGEVRQPGIYPVAGPMTLMRAIARAQGATDYAQIAHVVLFRTVNGRQMAALYDVRAIRLGAYEDPPVYPQDLIVVGESQARRLFPQIIQGVGLLLSPLITILGNNNNN